MPFYFRTHPNPTIPVDPIHPLLTKNWAGYFDGAVYASIGFYPSDSIIKTGITPILKCMEIIDSLKPRQFYYDTAFSNAKGLYLPGNQQYGFVAQDVDKILPDLVTEVTNPPQFDSVGNKIHDAYTFKALNYNGFIGILTQGVKSLDSTTKNISSDIDSIKKTKLLDYDFLLSGSSARPTSSNNINDMKYTKGYLQIDTNTTTPAAVLEVRNKSSIKNFNNTSAGLFSTDATSFTLPTTKPFINLSSDIYNIPNNAAQVVGINSHITSSLNNTDNIAIWGKVDGLTNDGIKQTGVKGSAQDGYQNLGVWGDANVNNHPWGEAYGVYGTANHYNASSFSNSQNVGVLGIGEEAGFNCGGTFYASSYNMATDARGVYAEASGADQSFGVTAVAYNSPINYGIYATTWGSYGSYQAAGYFDGDIDGVGNLYYASDAKLKSNFNQISHPLQIINALHPRSYQFNTTAYPYMNLSKGYQTGFVEQELEGVVPWLTKKCVFPAKYDSTHHMIHDTVQYKAVNYIGLIPIVVAAMQESKIKGDSVAHSLNNKIDSLKQVINSYESRFTNLEQMINACCKTNPGGNRTHQNSSDTTNTTEVYLENMQVVVLEQNIPNPFSESTVINYFIPDNINYAQMIFSDNFGRILKTVDITKSGSGAIKVYAANLSSGLYTYALMIDGKVVDSKKMVCTKK